MFGEGFKSCLNKVCSVFTRDYGASEKLMILVSYLQVSIVFIKVFFIDVGLFYDVCCDDAILTEEGTVGD